MRTFRILLFIISGFAIFAAAPAEVLGQEDDGLVRTVSEDVSIRLGGTIQPRVTFASDDPMDRFGFGLRRLRLRVNTDIGEKMGVFLQMEGAGSGAVFLDVRGDYELSDNVTLHTGRFIGAQPRAYARTSHASIDALDRPAISEKWARMTIGSDGRDYGVEAVHSTPAWELRGFLHNGYNQWNFRSGISNDSPTGGLKTDGVAFSASATHWPDSRDQLELGGYASINTSQNPLTDIGGIGRNYLSYSAHAYWGPSPGDQPIRLKTDLIGISYQDVVPFGAQNYVGASLFGSYLAAPHIELFARSEYWHDDGGDRDSFGQMFIALGGSYSLSALQGKPFSHNRLTVAYSLRSGEDDTVDFGDSAHVLMLGAQFYF